MFLLVALACVPAVTRPRIGTLTAPAPRVMFLVLLNGIRHEHGLGRLTGSAALRDAARLHSSDMLERGYFQHNSPNETFDKRIRRFLKSPLVGENIAWGTGHDGTAQGIVTLFWMHPRKHRRIILMRLHRVGLGIATGTYRGAQGAVYDDRRLLVLMTPPTAIAAFAEPRVVAGPAGSRRPRPGEDLGVLCCATASRGVCAVHVPARGMSESEVVVDPGAAGHPPLSVRRHCGTAESTVGSSAPGSRPCLADIYGTDIIGIAGRRLHRKRPSLDDFPSGTYDHPRRAAALRVCPIPRFRVLE